MNIIEKKQKVLSGEINPLQFYSELIGLEAAIKEAKEEILSEAIAEFEKYGSKSVREYGYTIESSQSGRYDYSSNVDWVAAKNKMKEIETKMQAAYKANGTILDEVSGEIFEAARYKANKQSLKFKKIK